LSQVVSELERELEAPDLSPTRRKAVVRQLLSAGLGLARLDRQEEEKRLAPAQPVAAPAPAQAPEPTKPVDPELRAVLGGNESGKTALKPTQDAAFAPALMDAIEYRLLHPEKAKAHSEPFGADVPAPTRPDERLPVPTSFPKMDTSHAPAVTPKADGPKEPMPKLLWNRSTHCDGQDIPTLCADFRLALSGNSDGLEAERRLEHSADANPRADTFAFRLWLLYKWIKRHPDFDTNSISLPAERGDSLSAWNSQPISDIASRVMRQINAPALTEEPSYYGDEFGMGNSAPANSEPPKRFYDPWLETDDPFSSPRLRPHKQPDGLGQLDNPAGDLRQFIRDVRTGKEAI
jgi:hypothetical protein